ncbi:hypothetical protein ACWEFJ_28510 [Actinosynnema sp. NPDC004786]
MTEEQRSPREWAIQLGVPPAALPGELARQMGLMSNDDHVPLPELMTERDFRAWLVQAGIAVDR